MAKYRLVEQYDSIHDCKRYWIEERCLWWWDYVRDSMSPTLSDVHDTLTRLREHGRYTTRYINI